MGKTQFSITLAIAIAISFALVFPFLAPNDYYLSVMSLVFINAIAACGLNLTAGYTGQLNLAHGGFFAIGAYTVGLLTVDYNISFWLSFALSGVITSLVGYFVGLLSLRLRGHYFAIFTLCVGSVIVLLIEKWDSLTHGVVGVIGIPAPQAIGPIQFDTSRGQYYLILFFLILGLFVMHLIVRSLLGRTFMAIRNSEDLAEALGIGLMRNKVLSFVISTFYAGIAGALYAGHVRFLGPDIAGVPRTFDLLASSVVGGLGTLMGPVVGALVVAWLTQYLQFLQDYRMVVFGPMLVLVLILFPRGIVGSIEAWLARRTALKTDISAAKAKMAEASRHA